MKSLFRYHTYTWWQISIFKLAMLSVGAAAGAHWHDFFNANMLFLLVVAILSVSYIWYITLKH